MSRIASHQSGRQHREPQEAVTYGGSASNTGFRGQAAYSEVILLVTQRAHGIDSHRAPGGDVSGKERDQNQAGGNS